MQLTLIRALKISDLQEDVIMPLHTIIMAVYNGERYLNSAIQSILDQTCSDLELILVDDCSSDKTLEILHAIQRKDSRIRLMSTSINSGGPAIPKNIGVSNASGEFISFCDQDDLLLPHKLERATTFFRQNPDYEAVFFDYLPIDANGNRSNAYLAKRGFVERARDYLSVIEPGIYECKRFWGAMAGIDIGMTTQTVVCRRKVFDKIRFDTRFRIVDDISVWYRVAEQFKIAFIDSPGALYRHHDQNLTTDVSLLTRETIAFHRENYFRQAARFNSMENDRYRKMLGRFFVRAASSTEISSLERRVFLAQSLVFSFSWRTLRWFLQTFFETRRHTV